MRDPKKVGSILQVSGQSFTLEIYGKYSKFWIKFFKNLDNLQKMQILKKIFSFRARCWIVLYPEAIMKVACVPPIPYA